MTEYLGLSYNDTGSTTLAGIKQDIYFIGKCNSGSISDGDLNRIINKYYAQCQDAIRSVNENFYMGEATTDLVIGDGSYTFPDGTGTAPAYEKIKSIWVSFLPADITNPQANEYQRVDIIDPDSISDPEYMFSTESSKALLFGLYFVLLPLVTDATKYPVTNGVKMYYIMRQDKLVNDVDSPRIFPSFHDTITWGALMDVATRLGNDELLQQSQGMFTKRLQEIKDYASAHMPLELGTVEGQEEVGGWAYPWGFNSMS